LKTGRKKVGVQDIAKVLKISASSVSRALNDHPRISKETKEKVKQVATRLGYHQGMPELMNPDKAEAVVVLVPSLECNLYREVVLGVSDYLHKNNFQTFLVNTQNDEHRVNAFFESYRKFGISGIVHLICKREIPGDFYAIPIKDAMPLVTVFEPDTNSGISAVLPDMFQGVFKIIKYLKSLGVARIALLLEDRNKPEDYQIVSAFETALEMLEIDRNNLIIFHTKVPGGKPVKDVGYLIKETEKPLAILVKGERATLEVINICERQGLKAPDDFLLISIDTDTSISGLTPNLSLLKLPGYEMGNKAAKMLMDQIKHPGAERKTAVVPVNFILKGSAIRIS